MERAGRRKAWCKSSIAERFHANVKLDIIIIIIIQMYILILSMISFVRPPILTLLTRIPNRLRTIQVFLVPNISCTSSAAFYL